MENNRQFELMRSAARQKLEGADPVRLSVLTGLCWDGRTFDTETLGIPIRISWPECQISPVLEMWHDLTILQYLANTKGTALMGKFLALSEFHSGGLAKGTSFDRDTSVFENCDRGYCFVLLRGRRGIHAGIFRAVGLPPECLLWRFSISASRDSESACSRSENQRLREWMQRKPRCRQCRYLQTFADQREYRCNPR